METVENFYCAPSKVLSSFDENLPHAVAVVAMDDHGCIQVYGSHSTPFTMLMLKRAIPEILEAGTPTSEA